MATGPGNDERGQGDDGRHDPTPFHPRFTGLPGDPVPHEVRRPAEDSAARSRPLRFEEDPRTSRGGDVRTRPVEVLPGEGVEVGVAAELAGTGCGRRSPTAAVGVCLEQSPNRADWGECASAVHLTDGMQVALEAPTPRRWIRLRLTPDPLDGTRLRASVWGFARRAS